VKKEAQRNGAEEKTKITHTSEKAASAGSGGGAVSDGTAKKAGSGLDQDAAPSAPRSSQHIETLAEADATQESLYAKRVKIYPREVHGIFATWRTILVAVTLSAYYLLPWLSFGEGRQAFLIDLPNRKFNFFMWTFWPQDLFYLSAVLIISALALFLFTAIAGRLWCGYACPQTVWTEVFLWFERWVEGDRSKQMKLSAAPWNGEKIAKRGTKHLLWIAFSLWTGFTFVGYVTPIRELSVSFVSGTLGPWETFWIYFYGFLTYFNAGWMREQVCIYMCPYARFQSAMFDKDTLIISYDKARGEPRGPRHRDVDFKAKGLGTCVDCSLCVQVCPTGIDIRNGLQYQCIACGACADVCDTVMEKMGYPTGLVRYTTQNELDGGAKRHILRPRVIVYGSLISAIAVALLVAVILRTPLALDVLRDRSSLYREIGQGQIENVYTLKIMNMDTIPHRYAISASGIEGVKVRSDRMEVPAASGEVVNQTLSLIVDGDKIKKRSTPVQFRLQAVDEPRYVVEEEARFMGPVE
jgi:cytochrome c oxidase accessory protein FixG